MEQIHKRDEIQIQWLLVPTKTEWLRDQTLTQWLLV